MYTDDEKIQIILNNVLAMLRNRQFEKDGVLENVIEPSAKAESQGDNIWTISGRQGFDYAVKIVFQNITSAKQSPISDFLANYSNYFRITVATSFKADSSYNTEMSQIFHEHVLMQDIAAYYLQPKFVKLTTKEKQMMMEEYNVNARSISKIGSHDPMYKYFHMKKGDVYRVIRASPASGQSIGYRIAKN